MSRRAWVVYAAAVAFAVVTSTSVAQSTLGYGSAVLVPVVAHTVSFDTEVFVHNPLAPSTLTVNVTLVEATTAAAPGPKSCAPVVVPPGGSTSFLVATQCSLVGSNHFGYLVVHDAAAEAVNPFFVYSRTQNPQAIGFSIEGFPTGSLTGQSQRVNGLKRSSGAPPYQTNCFVASFEKPVDYIIRLRNSGGGVIGTVPQAPATSLHLEPHQLVRYLDIFAVAGVVGDVSNVSAQINAVNPTSPGNRDHPLFASFCTVQDNVSFGADFRIGKSVNGWDATHAQNFTGCTPAGCGAYDYAITSTGKKQVFQVFIRPPDSVKCELLSDRLAELGLRLREPRSLGDCDLCSLPPGSTAAPTTPGAVVAGGFDQTGFYYETGSDVIRPSDGMQTRDIWTIEVSARNGLTPTVPIPFSLSCKSGNGIAQVAPFETTDDF